MEQYGRKLCIRIGVVPTMDNETLDGVLDKAKSLIKETSHDITSIIVRFSTFRDKAMFHRSRYKLKNNFKLRLDSTKNR